MNGMDFACHYQKCQIFSFEDTFSKSNYRIAYLHKSDIMSFSAILSQIKHKSGKKSNDLSEDLSGVGKPLTRVQSHHTTKPSPVSTHATPVITRKVDPAVERLKILRLQEREKKDAASAEASALKQKPSHTERSKRPSTASSKRNLPSQTRPQFERSASPPKRLTFSELMKEAQNKSIKDSEPFTKPLEVRHVPRTQPKRSNLKPKQTESTSTRKPQPKVPILKKNLEANRVFTDNGSKIGTKISPKPLAKPSAKLQAKLDSRKNKINSSERVRANRKRSNAFDEDEGEDEDDFIVDDEEDIDDDTGYDRDEIWKMFNKGKSRYSYDYDNEDLSDMEASGFEILKEENKAAKRARREELEEQERERLRIQEKKRRLGRS